MYAAQWYKVTSGQFHGGSEAAASAVERSSDQALLAGSPGRPTGIRASWIHPLAVLLIGAGAAHLQAWFMVDAADIYPACRPSCTCMAEGSNPTVAHRFLTTCKVASDVLLTPAHLEMVARLSRRSRVSANFRDSLICLVCIYPGSGLQRGVE